ncbi:MAG: alpha/beta fold hydrolase [Burkholderiales bacterium]|nr:alpha/beta fold hydrolase [Burkholderiales bacterium]
MAQYDYIYLHGFASGPASSKAQYFKQQLENYQQKVIIPDLNMDDFSNLTLSRQLNQVRALIELSSKPIIMFGSSMGGITAAILAEQYLNIAKVILLAPAFRISELWARGNTNDLKQWQVNQEYPIMHYSYNQKINLKYNFYLDLFKHNDKNFARQLPALIFHGIHDDIVPIDYSREYTAAHKLTTLIEVDDDHSLGKDLSAMWEKIKNFCELGK